jgi:polysaccharide export outer membrane protein
LTVLACLGLMIAACASSGGSIPIDSYNEPPDPTGGQYVISPGDLVNVQVFEQDRMSGRMRVRSDGRISVPLLGDVDAAGTTPAQLTAALETQLKTLILNPQVTISIDETTPLRISILGEVAMPGLKDLPRGAGLADAIAAAGGLSNFAHKDRIFVVRTDPKQVRLHFTYDRLTRAIGRAASFRLRAGDTVVVE